MEKFDSDTEQSSRDKKLSPSESPDTFWVKIDQSDRNKIVGGAALLLIAALGFPFASSGGPCASKDAVGLVTEIYERSFNVANVSDIKEDSRDAKLRSRVCSAMLTLKSGERREVRYSVKIRDTKLYVEALRAE